MEVEKLSTSKDREHCNFCDRGVIDKQSVITRLTYPYEVVYSFTRSNNGGVRVCICHDCMTELVNKVLGL